MKILRRFVSVLLASTFLLSLNVFAEPDMQKEAEFGIVQEQEEFLPDAGTGGESETADDGMGAGTEASEDTNEQTEEDLVQEDRPEQEENFEEGSTQEQLAEDEFSENEIPEEAPDDVLSEEALYNEEYIAAYGDPANDSSIADMVGNNYSNLAQPTEGSNSLDNSAEDLPEEIEENQALESGLDGNSVLSDEVLSETLPATNAVGAGDDDIFRVDPVSSPMYFANGNDDSVSLKTGDLMYTKSLFKMPGRNGLDLDVSIRYNSSDAVTTVDEFDYDGNSGVVNYRQFAAGWIFNFSNINIADKKSTYGYAKKNSISLADGSTYEFNDDLELINYDLNDMVLTKDTAQNQYVLTYANGREERFDGTYGNIVQIKDIYGNTIKFEYSEIEYHSGSFFNYLFNVNYYSRKMNLLTKITDSRNKVVTLEYGFDTSFSGKRINSITFLEDGSSPFLTLHLDTKESSKGKVYTLASVEDASGYKTTYEYEERQSYKRYEVDFVPEMRHMASCMLLSKVTYPTGGYSTYEYQTARSMHSSYNNPPNLNYDWYITYKISKKSDSSGYAIKYKYENDHTGYPYGCIDVSRDDRRLSVDMTYHTTVCFPGYETVYTFNRNHDMIKEQTYDKKDMVSSHVASGGDTGNNVVINGELYRVVSQMTQYTSQTFVYKINSEGETEYLTSIDKVLLIEAVRSYGNYILIFAETLPASDPGIEVHRFNTSDGTWDQYTTNLTGQTVDFTQFYYSGTMFTYDTASRTNGFQSIRFNPSASLTSNPWSTYTSMDVKDSITYLYSLSGSQYYKCGGTMVKYTPSSSTIEQKTISGLSGIDKGVGINTQAYVYSDSVLYQVNYSAGTLTNLCSLTDFPSNGIIYPDTYGHLYYLARENGAYNGLYNKIYKISMSSPNTAKLYVDRLFSSYEAKVIVGPDVMYIALGTNDRASSNHPYAGGFEKVKLTDNANVTYKRSMEYAYNTVHQRISTASKIARGSEVKQLYTETFAYLANHNLPVSTVDKLGNKTTYEYDTTYYLPTKITNFADTANALVTTNTLSADKTKIVSTSTAYDDRTMTTSYTYDSTYPGNVVMETLSETKSGQSPAVVQQTAYEYDSTNGYALVYKKSIKNVMSNNDSFTKVNRGDAETKYWYDNFGRPTRIEENGLSTFYTYQENGWLITEDYANGLKTEYNYESFNPSAGNRVTVNYFYEEEPSFYSSLGYTFYEYYDGLGRVIKRSESYTGSDGEKMLAQFVYDGHNLSELYDGKNNKTVYEYDSFDRQTFSSVLGQWDAELTPVSTTYDDFTLTTSQYYGSNSSKALYQSVTTDVAGRVVSEKNYIISNLYREMLTSYDYMGNVSSVTDPKGNVTSYTYNDLGQMTKMTDALLQETQYEYDALGNMTKMTTPGGSVTQYEYDNLGRLLKETDALGNSSYYSYYRNSGDYSKTKDKNNVITSYTYDEEYLYTGMLKSKTIGTTTISYTYDKWRNVAQINDGGEITSYTYTGNNLLNTKTTPDNKTITYEYDAMRNVSKVTDYSGTVTTYAYDAANRMTSVAGNGMTTSYEYDNDQGLLSKVSYGSSGKYQTFEYNLQGEPVYSLQNSIPYRYTYDDNGNLINEKIATTTINDYTYDELNRLDEVFDSSGVTTQYTYDANSNVISKDMSHHINATVRLTNAGETESFTKVTQHTEEMTYNANNQLTGRVESITGTSGGTIKTETATDTYTYTVAGSLSTKQEALGTASLAKTYSYNDRNQMIAYKENDVTKASYTYDAEGYRASKTVEGETTKFYWDRGYTINESDGTDFTASNTVGADEIVARQTAAATTYLVKDIHGDTVMTLNKNGTQNAAYDYYTYGEQWSHVGSQDNPYRYCGEYVDNETGFIYLRNRYYDPKLGRFTSEDAYWNPGNMIYGDNGTAGFPDLAAIMQSSNLYAYCMNNPVNFIDPWGGVAGEIFYSQEELVKDWAWNYYGVIDYTMFEQASAIYTGKDSSGRIFYSYTEAVVGYPHSVDAAATELMIPKGFSFYAVIHGHPRGAGLSEADMNYATNNYKPIFVVYYNAEYGGTDIKKYTDTRRNGFTAEHIVTSAPYKKLYPDSKKYYEALFKESWKQHTQIPCSFGYDCATIDWPRNR